MDEKINDEKALDCRDAIIDLKEQESKLIEQRFNNVKDEYDAILKQFEHTQSMLEGAIDITETSGYIVSTKYYDSLISNENEKINKLYAEREALVNSLNSALSNGKIDKYSESWYNMQDEIDSIDESIQAAIRVLSNGEIVFVRFNGIYLINFKTESLKSMTKQISLKNLCPVRRCMTTRMVVRLQNMEKLHLDFMA